MNGADVKAIREALGRALGRRISQRDLGLALRLAPKNAADTVRGWEDGSKDVTGPASVALELLNMGAGIPPPLSDGMVAPGADLLGKLRLPASVSPEHTAATVFRDMMAAHVALLFSSSP